MTEKHRFICEDSLDGIFTAVYDAWASRCGHDAVEISVREPENLEFFCQYHQIPSSSEKALKVARTLRQRLSVREYELICYAAVSYAEDKGTAVYQSLVRRLCFRERLTNQKNPFIRRINELYKNTWSEYHHLLGFTRFRELDPGILIAVIHPRNDLLLMLCEHFADRLPEESSPRRQLLCPSVRYQPVRKTSVRIRGSRRNLGSSLEGILPEHRHIRAKKQEPAETASASQVP